MIDLHTHSLLSDGVLLPTELARRAEVAGYDVIGITDHVDSSNIDFVIPRILKVTNALKQKFKIELIPGIELTHIPPQDFAQLVKFGRENGIKLIIGHGETIAEPVTPGTNKAAINAGVDILAHPGIISVDDAKLAAEKGVFLEISARTGHCLANGHVVKVALSVNAKLILNTDAHGSEDLINSKMALSIALAAGINQDEFNNIVRNTKNLAERLLAD